MALASPGIGNMLIDYLKFHYSDALSHRHSHCVSGLNMPTQPLVGLCAVHEMDVFNAEILDLFFTSGLGNNCPLFNASDGLPSPYTFRDLLEI